MTAKEIIGNSLIVLPYIIVLVGVIRAAIKYQPNCLERAERYCDGEDV